MGWILPALALGVSAYSAIKGVQGQTDANKQNLQIAREQMDFQKKMSSTAVQRRMLDLKKAGLNPVLAGLGVGAAAPSGQSAVMQNPYQGLRVSEKIASAMAAIRFEKEMKVLDGQRQLLEWQSVKTRGEAGQYMAMVQDPFGPKGRNIYAYKARALLEMQAMIANLKLTQSTTAINTEGTVWRRLRNKPAQWLVDLMGSQKARTTWNRLLEGFTRNLTFGGNN